MSTTFGIIKKFNDGTGNYVEETFEIAFRNSHGIHWLNNIAIISDALKDDFPVEALDNTPQGIYTIGDIKKEILEQSL